MLWEYSHNFELKLSKAELKAKAESVYAKPVPLECCQYCHSPMATLNIKQDPCTGGGTDTFVEVCKSCGWWVVTHHVGYSFGYEGWLGINRTAGILRELDVTDISIPLQELTKYLLANYDSRLRLHPRK